nr:hypothetical protein [Sphingomonas sp. CFBP 8760]
MRDLAGFAERGGYEVVEVFRKTASGMMDLPRKSGEFP